MFLRGEISKFEHTPVMQIGDRIREFRKARGLSQPQLADAVGVSPSAVGQWETRSQGVRKPPSRENLMKVALVLGVRVSDLTGDSAEEQELVIRDPGEIGLIMAFRRMADDQREVHLNLFYVSAGLAQSQKRNGNPGKGGKVSPSRAAKNPTKHS